MEKIQTLPIEVINKAQKASVPVNEEEFARQFQKFSQMKDEQSSKEEGLHTSVVLAPSVSEEGTEELENDDQVFTLINPFLHIQTESMEVKKDTVFESDLGIDAEVLSHDSTVEKLLVEFGKSDRSDEAVSFQLSNKREAITLNEESPELESHLLNEALVEPTEQVLFKDNKSNQPNDTVNVMEPASLSKSEEEGSLPLNRSVQSNETTQSVEAFDQTMRSVTVEETDIAFKSVDPEINLENGSKLSINKVSNSDEEDTLSHTFSLNEVKQTSEEISQPVQSTPSQTKPVVTVTKEEGMEMIKEMVTETLVDDNGVETIRSTIKLTPESLGEVEIELISTDKGLTGKIVFQSEEAKQWMEKEWEQFKLPLETKGVSFQTLELTVSQPVQNHTIQSQLGKFSFSENFSQSQQDQATNQQANHDEGTLTNEETENTIEQVTTHPLNGLNVYV